MDINFHDKNFYYNDITKQITDLIWSNLAASVKKEEGYVVWDYPIRIYDDNKMVSWKFEVIRTDALDGKHGSKDYDIWAAAGVGFCDDPEVEFYILVPKGKHVKKLKERMSYAELFGTVAHEIHHIAQNTDESNHEHANQSTAELVLDKKESEAVMEYYLDAFEIEAFHIGFRAETALTGEDLETCMRRYVSSRDCLSQEQVEEVISAWLNTDFSLAKENVGIDGILNLL